MVPRFLVPELDPARPETVLPPEEAHHLTRVLRLGVGDEIGVFDGRGLEFRGRVASISRSAVAVSLLEPVQVREPHVALTVVQSVLKADGMDGVVRDCTMVGARALQPVVSARSTVKHAMLPKAAERWRRVALASAKQCGRATLPVLHGPITLHAWAGMERTGAAFLLTEPSARATEPVRLRDLVGEPTPRAATLVIGPEGGWTREEAEQMLARGCRPLSLGPLTLRADAVALVAAAALLALWHE